MNPTYDVWMLGLEQASVAAPPRRGGAGTPAWIRRAERPLSRLEKLVLASIVARTYVAVRRALRHGDVRGVIQRIRPGPQGEPPRDPMPTAHRLARATVQVLRFLPGDTRCLTRSLVLSSLLSRAGITSSLVIGVKPGDDFGAHAWVEVGPHAVLPADEASFARLVEL